MGCRCMCIPKNMYRGADIKPVFRPHHPQTTFLTNRNDRLLKVSLPVPQPAFPIIITLIKRLEGWLSILEQHLKVSLVPLTSLWSGVECIGLATEGIVTVS